ncbi:winged helix-turn-helix domain-containing protein [Kitasatospora sp. NPDC002227]|uniref:winged helix-turn-helix domain-containing protein n=1 Tax=Kitasatospora sp. NPDC002227 TaxID=3154773 RepID=UPI00331D9564
MSTATATLPLPTTTGYPHLRAVRSVPPVRHSAPPQPAPAALVESLPAGASVVAALPQSAIPQGLLAQYSAQYGEGPLTGYLVLVPTEPAQAPNPVPAAAPRSKAHGINVDTERRHATVDGRQLDLTYLEFELLAHLTEHPQRVHTRDQLVSAVWGYGHVGDGRTVDVHVARLRRKLGPGHRDTIVTVRRVGYKYTPVQ